MKRYWQPLAALGAALTLALPLAAQQPAPPGVIFAPGAGGFPGYGQGGFPGYGPGGLPGYGQSGPQGYGQFGPQGYGQIPQENGAPGAANGSTLPPGVERLYGLQSDNSLLLRATPEGYDQVRALVKGLDGQLDIIRADVLKVEAKGADLQAAGVAPTSLTAGGVVPNDAAEKIVTALRQGKFVATQAVRITTRETTVVDTLLSSTHRRANVANQPLSLIPRETHDGTLTIELIQPVHVTCSARSGDTAVVALSPPAGEDKPATLLLVTPTLMPSDHRPAR